MVISNTVNDDAIGNPIDGLRTRAAVQRIFVERRQLLPPFLINDISHAHPAPVVVAHWGRLRTRFEVEVMTRASVRRVQEAVAQVRTVARARRTPAVLPLLVAPYFSDAALDALEAEMVSGVDLCGNGVIVAPERFLIRRGGSPNRYPDRAPLRDAFRGQAATVVRWLIEHRSVRSLRDLHQGIAACSEPVSLSQCSKTVSALHEDGFIRKADGVILVDDPGRLLDRLSLAWRLIRFDPPTPVHVPGDPLGRLARSLTGLPWVVSGASSVGRYTNLTQAGPIRILVRDVGEAIHRLGATPESVPAFASLLIQRCDEPAAFAGVTLDDGVRWATRLQTWLELSAGDARQVVAASEIFRALRGA